MAARLILWALCLALVWSAVLGARSRPLYKVDCSGGNDVVTHPMNCRKFYKCMGGVATLFICNKEFYFDPACKKYAEKSTVDCENIWDEKFDCSRGHDFVPDTRDCRWYYNCENGVPTTRSRCPGRQFFNPSTARCVQKRPADCKLKQKAMNKGCM